MLTPQRPLPSWNSDLEFGQKTRDESLTRTNERARTRRVRGSPRYEFTPNSISLGVGDRGLGDESFGAALRRTHDILNRWYPLDRLRLLAPLQARLRTRPLGLFRVAFGDNVQHRWRHGAAPKLKHVGRACAWAVCWVTDISLSKPSQRLDRARALALSLSLYPPRRQRRTSRRSRTRWGTVRCHTSRWCRASAAWCW